MTEPLFRRDPEDGAAGGGGAAARDGAASGGAASGGAASGGGALGFGLIGYGAVADLHVRALQSIEGVRLVGAAGRNGDKAAAFAARYGGGFAAFGDVADLLARDDVDVVCIVTSSGSHAAYAEAALKAGKHVVVEKPLAMTSRECDRLIALAEERGLHLAGIFQRRCEPAYAKAKRMLDEGRIGRLLFVEAQTPFYRPQSYYDSADWRGTIAEDGGALMNQGIHQVDLMLWYGGEPVSVSGKAATATHVMEAEDLAAAVVEFAGGAFGLLSASTSFAPGFPPAVKLFGERGSIWLEGNAIVRWEVPDVPPPEQLGPASIEGGSDPMAISYANHQRQLADIAAAIAAGRTPSPSAREARAAVRLVEAVLESARTRREVQFDAP